MTWDPTHPPTSGAIVSAPLRDNFAALDTILVAALTALANGQVLVKGSGPVVAGVAVGTDGQILMLVSGAPQWQPAPVSFANPMTGAGDLIVGGTAGAPTRLGVGSAGQFLSVSGGSPAWSPLPVDPGFPNPMSAAGDLITGGTAGAPGRLGVGATGQVLAVVAGAPAWTTASPVAPLGQCRLTKSGATLLLSPYQGNRLTINGVAETIPDAGVTLAATGLTADTLYYVYAWMSAGTLTLEASPTTHAAQAGTGVRIKSGDATRTLVGLAQTIAGPAWVDTDAQRYVLSYFNRREIRGRGTFTAVRTTTSTAFVELNSEIRVAFLTWGDTATFGGITGSAANSTAGATAVSGLNWDGTNELVCGGNSAAANSYVPIALSSWNPLAEGAHYLTLTGGVSAGTGTWSAGDTVPNMGRTRTTVCVQG